jgi:myo-inositol-1(or 4)-monophosphatase
VLIVQEAGGQVTRFDGQPFRIDSRETLASNGQVHEALLREFQAILRGEGLEELPSVAEYVRGRK